MGPEREGLEEVRRAEGRGNREGRVSVDLIGRRRLEGGWP